MHNIYSITFIFITTNIILSSAKAIPLEERPIYDELLNLSNKKCPYLKTTKLLISKPSYLNSCSDFSTLQNLTSIGRDSAYDVTCLLFANNFISLCNSTVDFPKIINNVTIDQALTFYNLSSACSILQTTQFVPDFKNGEIIVTLLKKPKVCNGICSEVTNEGITPICSLAAYLSIISNTSKTVVKTKLNANDNIKAHPDSSIADAQQMQPKPQPLSEQVAKDTVTKPKEVVNSEQKKDDHLPNQLPNKNELPAESISQPISQDGKKNSENIQHQLASNIDKTSGTHTDTEPEKPETVLSNPEQQPQSKTGDQPTGEIMDKMPIELNNQEQAGNSNTGLPVNTKDDHVEKMDDKKVEPIKEQNPSKSSTNEGEKKTPEVALPVNDNLDKDSLAQENQNPDEIEFEVDTNNIDDSDDINSPNNEDLKVEPEVQDSKQAEKVKQTNPKPKETDEDVVNSMYNNPNTDEEDSFFFIYFMMVCAVFILGYIGYHNKQKVLALVIEGRRGRRGSRRGRPNSANYHKLDSNLEEAVTSSCNKNTTNIIY